MAAVVGVGTEDAVAMTDAHVHAADLTHELLRLEWCACGYERSTARRRATWNKPRKLEGLLRYARWRG